FLFCSYLHEVVEERRAAAEVGEAAACRRVAVDMIRCVDVPPDPLRDHHASLHCLSDECHRPETAAVVVDAHPLAGRATPRRSLPATRPHWPCSIPRDAASWGWISMVGAPACSRSDLMLTNVELRNDGCGGLTICSGKRAARSGRVCGSSCGGV